MMATSFDAIGMLTDPAAAAAVLDPTRARILSALVVADATPDSASGLARRLEMPRQRVNYHLRELEAAGLVRCVESRRKGNCIERLFEATATRYLISPEALGALGAGAGASTEDRFSWSRLVGLAARAIRELALLRRRADESVKGLPTMSLDAVVKFDTAEDLHAFASELAAATSRIIAKYDDASSPEARAFRFLLASWPAIAGDGEGRADEPDGEVSDE